MMVKLIGAYKNGNYTVNIFSDGTKIRFTEYDKFNAQFPENIDLKITDYCNMGCKFCHENSTVEGKHANFVGKNFLITLRPGTELAIGGGNPLDHPQIIQFLEYCKSLNLVPNITVHQVHFEQNIDIINYLINNNLIYGLGVSLSSPSASFIKLCQEYNNLVIHTINGITKLQDYEILYNKNLKVLILGYKFFRRGQNYFNDRIKNNMQILLYNIDVLMDKKFKVLSFDNLAIDQLDMKSHLSNEDWERLYMGNDGQHTMYIDLVNEKFARNSTTKQTYDLLDNIDDMFSIIKNG